VTIEVTVLTRLPLPGATPDLVTVTVVALALALGPVPGAVVGFFAGLAVDISPPSDDPVGVTALVLTAVGFAIGLASSPEERSAWASVGLAAAACAGTTLAFALVTSLIGSPRVRWEEMGLLLATTALYGALLATFMVPLVLRLTAAVRSSSRIS
jgi:rod shape-determining protein MreD